MDHPATTRHETLHSLPHGRVPDDLPADLKRLAALPEGAKKDFWAALGPHLGSRVDEDAGARMGAYCRLWDVTLDDLGPVIRACRHLFRQGALRDVGVADLGGDVVQLTDGDTEIAALLMLCYERAFPALRAEVLREVLSAQGKLVTDFGFRLDRIVSNDRGARIDTPVLLLTLRYQEGDRADQVTLQLLPGQAEELRELLAALRQ